MNKAMKEAILSPQRTYLFQRAALFHSTPVLEYQRRNRLDEKRHRRRREEQELARSLNSFGEIKFEGWKGGFQNLNPDPSSSKGPSGSKKQHSKRSKMDRLGNKGSCNRGRRPFEFFEDDDDVENKFRSAFGGSSRFFYWSFINKESPHSRSSRYSNNYDRTWSWKSRLNEEYGNSTESDSTESLDRDTLADRRALGLNASGPLTLDAVKTAYRACPLKWHPDRHHGSSKAVAEEKFKNCNSAYQSLCDKLGLN